MDAARAPDVMNTLGLGTGPNDLGLDPAALAGYAKHPPRMGFFTDTSVCIGCKACEVACKEWNLIPADGQEFLSRSYDNTGELGSESWRHVEAPRSPVLS